MRFRPGGLDAVEILRDHVVWNGNGDGSLSFVQVSEPTGDEWRVWVMLGFLAIASVGRRGVAALSVTAGLANHAVVKTPSLDPSGPILGVKGDAAFMVTTTGGLRTAVFILRVDSDGACKIRVSAGELSAGRMQKRGMCFKRE